MKKRLALFLSLAVSISSVMPIFANNLNTNLPVQNIAIDKAKSFTQNGITYTITQDAKETLQGFVSISSGKDVKVKSLNIPKTVVYQGQTYTVDSIAPYAFYQNNIIETVNIPDSVKNIGNQAFTDCQSLKSINVTPGANRYASIDGVLFNVSKDTLITYPAGKANTHYTLPFSVKKIEQGAFYNNKNLERFIANSSLEEIGSYAFASSKKLIEVSGILKLKTLGDYAFANSSVESVYLSTYLENMGKATFYKSNIKNIEIPYRIKSLPEYSFYGCKNLKNVTFKNGLNNIEKFAFYDSGIESFVAPSSLLSIDYQAFANCENLKNVSFNDSLQTIKDEAFLNCSKIPSITIKRDLKTIGNNVFLNCNSISTVSINSSIYFEMDNNVLYTKNKDTLVYVPPKREISYINIPEQTKSIKEDALVNALSIDAFNVDDKNKYLSSQDGILYDKDQNKLIKYPPKKTSSNFNIPSSVKEISPYAFKDASKFYGFITLQENVEKIGDNAFDNMPNLDGFNVFDINQNFSTDNNVLYNKDKTTLIKYPTRKKSDSFTMLNQTKTISPRAFEQANIAILNLGVNLETIEEQAFLNTNINKLNIKEGVKTIKAQAFTGSNIESLVLPASLQNIDDEALSYCNNLKTVQFNALQLSSFGYNIFIGSNNLQKVIVPVGAYNNYKNYLINSGVLNWQSLLQEYVPPVENKK